MSTAHPLRDWRNKEGPFEDRVGNVMSQEKLAEAVGVVGSQISQIETGDRRPSMGLALRISSLTGISIDALAAFEKVGHVERPARTPAPAAAAAE